MCGAGYWQARWQLAVGLVVLVAVAVAGCAREEDRLDDLLADPDESQAETPYRFLEDLSDRTVARLDEDLDFEAVFWCDTRDELERYLPPAGAEDSWWAEPGRDRHASDVWGLIDGLNTTSQSMLMFRAPETLTARICSRCAHHASPIPEGSPRLPSGVPGVWAPDCEAAGEDELLEEIHCSTIIRPEECEAAAGCWFRYSGATGCVDQPDLVAWTQQWCEIRRDMESWDAERLSITDTAARQDWLAQNQPAFDELWDREQGLYAEHDGFDPTGSYLQPLKCELCPDQYDDC